CIAQVKDYLVIRDLCSTNGIRINGHKVAEGELRHGDEVTIGNFQFRVSWPGQPEVGHPNGKDEPGKRSPALALLEGSGGGGGSPMESCEQPIALPDRAAPQVPARQDSPSAERKAQMEDQPPSLILPDNLELAPS